MSHPIVSTPLQADFLAIPETPLVYWLRPGLFELLQSPSRLRDIANVRQGLVTADNERFTRCFWQGGAHRGRYGDYQGRERVWTTKDAKGRERRETGRPGDGREVHHEDTKAHEERRGEERRGEERRVRGGRRVSVSLRRRVSVSPFRAFRVYFAPFVVQTPTGPRVYVAAHHDTCPCEGALAVKGVIKKW
ncbi:MAG: hypothetical protein HYY04_01570 [Chloroflexi bacterium]|nr:hypothetical protein [Chloroflexota bacterium]